MSELTTAVCSITTTKRRRFFWAAWWSHAPCHTPFQKPDAANGGARTREEALAEAVRAAGRTLTLTDGFWARAWMCVLRGQPVPPLPQKRERGVRNRERSESAWSVLGLEPGAPLPAIRRAFHQKALETHPDRGGDATRFRAVMRAYERLIDPRRAHRPRRRARR